MQDEGIATLEGVLRTDPEHIGAIHLYIHAVEASSTPERAERYADRLGDLCPGAGHLVHADGKHRFVTRIDPLVDDPGALKVFVEVAQG